MIKSRRWAGHVARIEDSRGAYRVLVGGPREGDHSEDLDVDEMII